MNSTSNSSSPKRDWTKPVLTNISISNTELNFNGTLSDMSNTSTASIPNLTPPPS